MRVDDINLGKAKFTERRKVSHNPLEPVYSLPSLEEGTVQIVGPIESNRPYLKHLNSPGRQDDVQMKTDDIRGAMPKKLDCTFNYIKESFRKGPVVYENKNYLGNGDIISNKTNNPIGHLASQHSSKAVIKNKQNKADYQDQLRENYQRDVTPTRSKSEMNVFDTF